MHYRKRICCLGLAVLISALFFWPLAFVILPPCLLLCLKRLGLEIINLLAFIWIELEFYLLLSFCLFVWVCNGVRVGTWLWDSQFRFHTWLLCTRELHHLEHFFIFLEELWLKLHLVLENLILISFKQSLRRLFICF